SPLCAENVEKAKPSNLNVTLDGVTVKDNYTEAAGTLYFVAKSGEVNVAIKDCEITGNVAEGDAIDFGLHQNGQSLTATVTGTTITGNRLDKDDRRGDDHGAVALWQNNGKVLDVTFEGCTIQDNGGGCTGIYYHNENGNGLNVENRDNTICGNGKEGNEGISVKYKDGTTLDAMHTQKYLESLDDKDVIPATCVAEGSITYTCPYCLHPHTVTTEVDPDNHDMGGWYVSKQPGPGVEGEERRDCQRVGCDYYETKSIPAQPVPGVGTSEEPTVEIEDVEVPLAGIFTRADAIGYLWEKSGKPEAELSTFKDVPEDHQWAVAIGWAQDMGIALPDQDGNFRPDDLVLRSVESLEISPEGEFQEFLNRYAVYAGIKLDAGELFIELEGAWSDIIMGEEAHVIFNDFFAKLEAALTQAA
ncbi:MAG: S-layer homology domain-containing protein, partial [Oscillospiraceae bacterium]|nr:S-layer homology domain-containing protein [Oscillospiraceae bacterium]